MLVQRNQKIYAIQLNIYIYKSTLLGSILDSWHCEQSNVEKNEKKNKKIVRTQRNAI